MFSKDLVIGQKFTFPAMLAWMKGGELYTGWVGRDIYGSPVVLMRIDHITGQRKKDVPYVYLEPAECRGQISYCGPESEPELVESVDFKKRIFEEARRIIEDRASELWDKLQQLQRVGEKVEQEIKRQASKLFPEALTEEDFR